MSGTGRSSVDINNTARESLSPFPLALDQGDGLLYASTFSSLRLTAQIDLPNSSVELTKAGIEPATSQLQGERSID